MAAAAAAAALTLRRTVSPSLLTNLFSTLRPAHFAPAATRSFNSDAQMSRFDDDDSESDDERPFAPHCDSVPSRRAPFSFSDVFSLSPVDQPSMANPFLATGARRGWDVKEDKDGLYLLMDMPGLGKENVKVSVEQNTLVIKGEGNKEADDDEEPRRYYNRIDLPEKMVIKLQQEADGDQTRGLFPSISEPRVADFNNNYSNSHQKALQFYSVKFSMANPNWSSIGKIRHSSTSSSTPGSRGPKVKQKPRIANETKQSMDSSDDSLGWALLACAYLFCVMPSSWFFFYWYLAVFFIFVYLKK